jgi:dTDP-4-amino-4,6-dideoxygalactose transaminase
MTPMNIKLNDLKSPWELIKNDALPEIEDFLSSGHYVNSPYVKRFEDAWSSYTDLKYSIMVSSGTDAYKVCLQSFDFTPKETCVLLQNNTWATILYVTKYLGFNYDFIDCDNYLQYSVEDLQKWLELNRSKYKNVILVPTHILGHPCDTPSIYKLAINYECRIIEDCSQAHGAELADSKVGYYGDVSFWSCFPGKNLGGVSEAGIISTLSQTLANSIRSLINCGMYDKYKFSTEGSNHRPSGISAIVLYHKLKYLDSWNTKRQKIASEYDKFLYSPVAPYCKKHVYHYYYFFTTQRASILKSFEKNKIPYNINYPFTLSSLDNSTSRYEVSERVSKEIVCVPCHPYMNYEEVYYILDTIKKGVPHA